MGLTKIIKIPCHHVLANQNDLKFKRGAPLKQIFNINLGIGIIKKTTFLFVFSTYLFVFLLKFRSGEDIGCENKFCIQWVPTQHTFDGTPTPKTRNTWKKWNDDIIIPFFHVFLVFGVGGPSKVCRVGTHWMRNLIPRPTSSLDRNFSKNTERYVKNTNKK